MLHVLHAFWYNVLEALLGVGGGGVSHPFSLKFRGQLSLIPKITETVILKTTYLVILRLS